MPNRRAAVLILALLAALPSSAAAAPADQGAPAKAWTAVTGGLAARGQQGAPVETRPRKFAAFTLSRSALQDRLAGAPLELTRGAQDAPALVSIPAPDGTLQRFEAVESPVMEPALARRHPEISTFSAVGVDDPTATARFDVTALGFHASVRSDRGYWYVDPYYRNDDLTHVSYFGRDLPNVHGPLVEPDGMLADAARSSAAEARAAGDLVVRRTYRLALLTDPTYAAYFGGGANVASANATLLNRVNQIYNDDLAIRLLLVANNDAVNLDTQAEFSQPLGPCGVQPCFTPPITGDACGLIALAPTLDANQMAIDAIIGDANYDVGHIGLGVAGGGVAGLGVVGQPGAKAMGCTGVPTPKGDLYAVDYFAHEVGHQFGGNHTFNGTGGSCSGNENNDTGVEPGSGSSIQAYAGICDTDNLQPHSDPYFSQKSIDEIQAYVTSNIAGSTEEGSTITTTANHSPIVTAPPARTIPVRTPFTLTGTATDSDGQSLIYLWEQNDGGAAKALLDNAKPAGALFRVFSFAAGVSATDTLLSPSPGENVATAADLARTFPDAGQVAAGNTNAATGTCPAASTPPTAAQVDCFSEFLPTSARTLNFRLTARDRFATGGGVTLASTVVTVAGTAPFRVTSQTAPASVGGGSVIPVTWDVAGTSAAPFNTPNVRIRYSTDGGLTFPTELLAATANDGSQNVTIPTTATTQGRIRVEAVGNYFFDVTRANLTVTAAPATTPVPSPTYVVPTPTPTPTPTPGTGTNRGFVRPDVSRTPKRLKVKRNRTVKVRVACLAFNSPKAKQCKGTLGLFAKIDGGRQRRIARKAIAVPRGKTRTITLKLSGRSFRILGRRGTLSAKVRARTNGGASRKQVTLRR